MVKKIIYVSLFVLVFLLAIQSVSASGIDLDDVNANNFKLDDSSNYLSSSISENDVIAGENNPIVTEINVHPITFDYLSEGKLNINLTDENGLGVSNKTISVQIGEDISNLSTDENGVAVFKYSNSAGSYKVNISFNGDEYYAPSNATTKITITKSSTKLKVPNVRSYLTTSTYVTATLTDSNGNTLANKTVSFVISKKTYNATTNGKGIAKIKIP